MGKEILVFPGSFQMPFVCVSLNLPFCSEAQARELTLFDPDLSLISTWTVLGHTPIRHHTRTLKVKGGTLTLSSSWHLPVSGIDEEQVNILSQRWWDRSRSKGAGLEHLQNLTLVGCSWSAVVRIFQRSTSEGTEVNRPQGQGSLRHVCPIKQTSYCCSHCWRC